MKKKHLKSLSALQKWLEEKEAVTEEAKNGLTLLRELLEGIPEEETPEVSKELPPPLEIAHEPASLALYSDGGCRGNPGPGAFAFVLQGHDGGVLAEGVEFDSMTTNNKMELSGALRGLEEALVVLPTRGLDPLLTKIKVMTDSKYVVEGMKSWVRGWKARGWKKADNKAPENLELWQALDEIRGKFMLIEWMWVRGHAGHAQNEYCDRKANEVMDKHS